MLWLEPSASYSDTLIVSSFSRQSQAWQALRLSCCLHALTCIPAVNAWQGEERDEYTLEMLGKKNKSLK